VDAPTLVEVVSSVSEVVVALGALGFALALAQHETKSRERIEKRLDALTEAIKDKAATPQPESVNGKEDSH